MKTKIESTHSLPIKPEVFWSTFSEKFRNLMLENQVNIEIYKSKFGDEALTGLMTDLIENLGEKEFNLHTHLEYYKIDVCYFSNADKEWSEWSLEAVIEIENNPKSWHEELSKLMQINCGLKVLITYFYDDSYIEEQLNTFKEIYKSRKYHQKEENWVLVFGPYVGAECYQDFKAFSFDGDEIIKLEERTTISDLVKELI